MNENEIERIAAMGNALRPDWPAASLRSLLQRPDLVNRSRRDVAVALAWVACDSSTKTPARVIEAGPWWQAVADPSSGSAPRVNWLNRCHTCNYPESACRRIKESDPDDHHEFVSNRDYHDGRARPQQGVPMPDDVRKKLGLNRMTEPQPTPTDPTEEQE